VFRASLRFSDGVEREVEVPDGQTVLAAAHDSDINLASQCQVGTCGTCAARLVKGEAAMREGCVSALTRAEVAAGHRLLCQTVAGADPVFDMGYPSALLDANPLLEFTAKISSIIWLSDSVVQLDVKVPKSLGFRFTSGQYCRIMVPGTDQWRSYSMASAEHERGRLSFLIRILPDGVMSAFLREQARPGMSLEMDGPLGSFVLEDDPRPHVMLAGGTGLAPMLSMLDKIRLMRPAPPVLLLFGSSTYAHLFGTEELEARTSYMPGLTVRTCISREPARPGHTQGNPVTVLASADVPADAIAYLCGPPGMVSDGMERLIAYGLPAESIRAEQFLPS
jgi:ferredoxin-NADP reductase/ferredoxin